GFDGGLNVRVIFGGWLARWRIWIIAKDSIEFVKPLLLEGTEAITDDFALIEIAAAIDFVCDELFPPRTKFKIHRLKCSTPQLLATIVPVRLPLFFTEVPECAIP